MTYAIDTVQQVLDAYSPGYSDGLWQSTAQTWSAVQGGAATAAATLYVIGGRQDPDLLLKAQKTVDRAITMHRQPDGSFVTDPTNPTPDIDGPRMIFWAPEMAMVYLLVAQDVTPGTASKWRNCLRSLCDYWVAHKELTFYENGNLNLQMAEAFWMTWRATGDTKYLTYYQQKLANTITATPAADGTPRGLVIDSPGLALDGSTGTAYFTETGAGGTGYDPEYTQLQLEPLVRLWLLSGDLQVLRLANMLTNKLLQRVDRSTMMLDAREGTRHTQYVRTVPFMTPALSVLGTFTGDTYLASMVPTQQAMARAQYLDPANLHNDDFRRGLGNDLSVQALADARYARFGLT